MPSSMSIKVSTAYLETVGQILLKIENGQTVSDDEVYREVSKFLNDWSQWQKGWGYVNCSCLSATNAQTNKGDKNLYPRIRMVRQCTDDGKLIHPIVDQYKDIENPTCYDFKDEATRETCKACITNKTQSKECEAFGNVK